MAKEAKKSEDYFLISFDGLNLSKDQKKRIEKNIQELVMKELATIDHGGDITISKRFTGRPTWEDLWRTGQLAGFWIGGVPNFPPGGPGRPI